MQANNRSHTTRRRFLQTSAATAVGASLVTGRSASSAELPQGVVEVFVPNPKTGSSRAVVVGDVPLIHTAQTLGSLTQNGSLPAKMLAGVGGCIRALESQLAVVGSTLDDVVK